MGTGVPPALHWLEFIITIMLYLWNWTQTNISFLWRKSRITVANLLFASWMLSHASKIRKQMANAFLSVPSKIFDFEHICIFAGYPFYFIIYCCMFFRLLNYRNSLYILETSPLSDICIINISFLSLYFILFYFHHDKCTI